MTFIAVFVLWIFSLCLHEYAHARVAYAGGDTTVEEKGYLSFNPLRYADPVYSMLMPLLFLVLGGIGLPGGAVYIEEHRLRGRSWRSAVSAAGPAANLILAVFFGLVFRLAPYSRDTFWAAIAFVGLLQVTAVMLNLLPVPPLDGYGILEPWLSRDAQAKMRGMGNWSLWILFLVLWYVEPANRGFWYVVYTIANGLGIPVDLAWDGFAAFRFWQGS
jgi:Zn-dependent protease